MHALQKNCDNCTILNLHFSTPNAISTVFLVEQWALLYHCSLMLLATVNGVNSHLLKGYPESPRSHPLAASIWRGTDESFQINASCVAAGRHLTLFF